jgi:hypothetical protein
MQPTASKVIIQLSVYDRWFLVFGLALCAIGYFVAPGSAAFWLFILGGTCIGVSTSLNMARGVMKERGSRKP